MDLSRLLFGRAKVVEKFISRFLSWEINFPTLITFDEAKIEVVHRINVCFRGNVSEIGVFNGW
jgi:hypothetical protein